MEGCRRCIISGRVQGVFYRQSTKAQALKRGLKGWVRNLPNGDVECVVCGPLQDIEDFCAWLWEGPPAAKVTAVSVIECASEDHPTFIILR